MSVKQIVAGSESEQFVPNCPQARRLRPQWLRIEDLSGNLFGWERPAGDLRTTCGRPAVMLRESQGRVTVDSR